jgi:hypothetical protein
VTVAVLALLAAAVLLLTLVVVAVMSAPVAAAVVLTLAVVAAECQRMGYLAREILATPRRCRDNAAFLATGTPPQ